jgi:2-methylisocitrate lyase-like PEP mutase family enzyme
MSENMNAQFRELLDRDAIAVLPGCYDALSAHIIEHVGFDAVYVSGAGVSNTKLGLADVGLTTLTEMRDRLMYIRERVSVPIFADADTGYGNPIHVRRTVQSYEQAGVSALHLEDQQFPKQCGHFEDKQVIPTDEMRQKIIAALDARSDPAFTIVARTDARAVDGMDEAIERANVYADAGADVIFPEAPQSETEMQRFCAEIDAPVMANMVEYGNTPLLSVSELDDIGFDLVIFPNSLLRSAMVAMLDTAEHIENEGKTSDALDEIASFELRNELTDYESIRNLAAQYES